MKLITLDELVARVEKRAQPSVDLTGTQFGRLTAISYAGRDEESYGYWLCQCECEGRPLVVLREYRLKRGTTQSCGCYRRERMAGIGRATKTHGLSAGVDRDTPEGATYLAVITRCFNPNSTKYGAYGAKGITVCPRWLGPEGFANFKQDMGPRPDGTSIDRIDVHGNYEASNCRWATPAEQSRNKTNNVRIEFQGETLCLTDWAERYGLKRTTLAFRLKAGWTIEQALTTKLKESPL